MEDLWLKRAKRIQAIASTGLHYTDNDYDRDRYRELAALAQTMLADLGQVPVSRIPNLFPDFAKGYATPLIDVRGAVIRGDRILLVRERTDGKWCLPGGFADVGLSAAENVVKEISEEAGLQTTAEHLFLIRHKARHPYTPDARDFYKMFFLCREARETPPVAGHETLEAAFFALDHLPALSQGRTIQADITSAMEAHRGPQTSTLFD